MISLVIPTYRNPEYLDLCLRSAIEGRKHESSEIIVVVDGFIDESMPVLEKYKGAGFFALTLDDNMGMQYALNLGVMNSQNFYSFIINDDNVLPMGWDERTMEAFYDWPEGYPGSPDEDLVITVNQVEPADGIYDFVVNDLGRTADTFDYEAWKEYEPTIADERYTPNGRIFPFCMSKKVYMAVGGLDTFYQSPFFCDLDFFMRLELLNFKFRRWHGCHLYHFGSIATKNRGDAEAEIFKRSEGVAASQFEYKWNFIPDIVGNARDYYNTRLPEKRGADIRGIHYPPKPRIWPKNPKWVQKDEV